MIIGNTLSDVRQYIRRGAPSYDAGLAPAWAYQTDMWRDFQRNTGSGLEVSDTHAQQILAPNSAGSYLTFAPNETVRTDLGLQTVPTRTNSLTRSIPSGATGINSAPTNWSYAGNANGVVRNLLSYGIEDGLPYCDLNVSGVAAGNGASGFNFDVPIAVVAGQTWANSVFYRIVGPATNLLAMTLGTQDSDGSFPGGSVAAPTLSRQRGERVVTVPVGVTSQRPFLLASYIAGPVDFTLRIYAPQFELGAFATPPILTSGAAVTVNGNLQNASQFGSSLTAGISGLIQFDLKNLDVTNVRPFVFNDGTGNNVLRLDLASSGVASFTVSRSGDGSGSVTLPVALANGVYTIAFAATTNFLTARAVGQVQSPVDSALNWPSGMDRMAIGGNGITVGNNVLQYARKIALKFGPQDQASFDAMYARATLA